MDDPGASALVDHAELLNVFSGRLFKPTRGCRPIQFALPFDARNHVLCPMGYANNQKLHVVRVNRFVGTGRSNCRHK
jgi:hypothetical protein